jgi:hypothetical protein
MLAAFRVAAAGISFYDCISGTAKHMKSNEKIDNTAI